MVFGVRKILLQMKDIVNDKYSVSELLVTVTNIFDNLLIKAKGLFLLVVLKV